MRKFFIPDKFKGSFSAEEVIKAVVNGIDRVYPLAKISSTFVSDGGDGFLHAIMENIGCEQITTYTIGPLGRLLIHSICPVLKRRTRILDLLKIRELFNCYSSFVLLYNCKIT